MPFVNALIIIWLSQGGNILISLTTDIGNRVVAYEKAYNMNNASQVIQTAPLGSDCVRVSIHDQLDDNAPLPIPHGEITIVGDVVSAFVAWPKKLITLNT